MRLDVYIFSEYNERQDKFPVSSTVSEENYNYSDSPIEIVMAGKVYFINCGFNSDELIESLYSNKDKFFALAKLIMFSSYFPFCMKSFLSIMVSNLCESISKLIK